MKKLHYTWLTAALLCAASMLYAKDGVTYGTIDELRGIHTYAIHLSAGCEKLKNSIVKAVRKEAPELRVAGRGEAAVVLALHYVPIKDIYGKNAPEPPVQPLGQSVDCKKARRARPKYILRGYAVRGKSRIVWAFEPKTGFSTAKDFGDEFAKAYKLANKKSSDD